MEDNIDEQKQCVVCEESATFVCFDCKNYYCEDCFNCMHKKEKSKYHKKAEISPILPIEINCLKHQGYQIVSFCLNDKGK
jgi:hypothetical protein